MKLNKYSDNKIFINMKADTFIKILRKVIREEVQAVVREELGLMLEAPEPKPAPQTRPRAHPISLELGRSNLMVDGLS
jgi:hypothetical protein